MPLYVSPVVRMKFVLPFSPSSGGLRVTQAIKQPEVNRTSINADPRLPFASPKVPAYPDVRRVGRPLVPSVALRIDEPEIAPAIVCAVVVDVIDLLAWARPCARHQRPNETVSQPRPTLKHDDDVSLGLKAPGALARETSIPLGGVSLSPVATLGEHID